MESEGGLMTFAKYSFLLSGIYDLVFGLIFLIAPAWAFNFISVTPPNHWGYVTFAASVLAIFGVMFCQISEDPVKNRSLMPYGMLLKIAYCGMAFGYYFITGIPYIWVVLGFCDLIFLLLFILSYVRTAKVG